MQQLLNPFAQKYPENVEGTLPSQATSLRFNPSGPFAGHYLAAGGSDGVVEVWDVETRGVVRILEGHVKAVGSVCWSRNNRYLLSASLDSTCIIWDLSRLSSPPLHPSTPLNAGPSETSPRFRTIRFDAPVVSACFHPRNCKIVLATLTCNEVVLVDLRIKGPGRTRVLEDVVLGERDGEEGEGMEVDGGDEVERDRKRATLACAAFSPYGSRIYAGSTQGEILVVDPVTRYVIHRVKVANAAIRLVSFSPDGRHLILSSTDRALRLLGVSPVLGTLHPVHRFQDLVNRTPWHAAGFSGDGEYVMGGAGHKVAHNVFVWDRDSGVLVKVLEGPKESLVDCDWHPTRPMIASASTSGDIYFWQTSVPDNWAAFAPGFEELEENIEYDEREDEFDIYDDALLSSQNQEEDAPLDLLAADDSFPRRPQPSLPTAPTEFDDSSEEARAVAAMREAAAWADAEPDGDTWEGFYLSLDLLEEVIEDDPNG